MAVRMSSLYTCWSQSALSTESRSQHRFARQEGALLPIPSVVLISVSWPSFSILSPLAHFAMDKKIKRGRLIEHLSCFDDLLVGTLLSVDGTLE